MRLAATSHSILSPLQMRRAGFGSIAVAVGLLASAGAAVVAAQQDAPPMFREGTDIVQLDIFVWDKNRKPVLGLTAADFTVLENRKPQAIESLAEVILPPRVAPTAPWLVDVAPDVVSNTQEPRRLIVIAIDDGRMGAGVRAMGGGGLRDGQARGARQAAHAVIDQLGPSDQAAVVFSSPGHMQEFTTDRTRLRAAVESLQPRAYGLGGVPLQCALQVNSCVFSLFKRVADVFAVAPSGPRLVVFISESTLSRNALTEVITDLQKINANVYPIDPRGLTTSPPDPAMRTLAETTGGRVTINTNAVWRHVPEIFEASQSYYALGYRSNDATANGQFRKIEITIKGRPELRVQTRSGYEAPKAAARVSRTPPAEPLDIALARPLSSMDVPLQVNTIVTAVPGEREAMVAGIVTIGELAGTDPLALTKVTLVTKAYDSIFELRDETRTTVEWSNNGAISHDLVSRLRLATGRYQVRIGVERAGRVGTIYADVDVPDFVKESLSASSLSVSLGGSGRAPVEQGGRTPLSTTKRDFGISDRPEIALQFYQGAKDPVTPVTVAVRVVDSNGRTVAEETSSLTVGAFNPQRVADYRWSVPLSRFASGPYLLTIEATKGRSRVVRQLRFTAEGGVPSQPQAVPVTPPDTPAVR